MVGMALRNLFCRTGSGTTAEGTMREGASGLIFIGQKLSIILDVVTLLIIKQLMNETMVFDRVLWVFEMVCPVFRRSQPSCNGQ